MPPSGLPKLGFRERQAAQALEFCAVYLVSPTSAPMPVRIGVGSDISKRLSDLQTANWISLQVAALFWFVGKPLAHRVAAMAESYLALEYNRLKGDWFDADSGMAGAAICHAAQTLTIPWFDENERRRRLGAEVSGRLDRAMTRLYGNRA